MAAEASKYGHLQPCLTLTIIFRLYGRKSRMSPKAHLWCYCCFILMYVIGPQAHQVCRNACRNFSMHKCRHLWHISIGFQHDSVLLTCWRPLEFFFHLHLLSHMCGNSCRCRSMVRQENIFGEPTNTYYSTDCVHLWISACNFSRRSCKLESWPSHDVQQ